MLGGRGSRSGSSAARRAPERLEASPARVAEPLARPGRRPGASMAPLAGLAAGGLIAGLLVGDVGHGLGDGGVLLWLGGSSLVVLLMFRRRQSPTAQRPCATLSAANRGDAERGRTTTGDHPGVGSGFEQGVRDIRRTDPGFDPARFAGYTGMVFRDAQAAWMTRDLAPLCSRVTPEMYGELQAQCDGLRDTGYANRVEEIQVTTEITEAWQEGGRDYVTASIAGSVIDYTVDVVSGRLVHGSRTVPRAVEEFWTFTRPAGLNFWSLSAVQTA